MRVFVTPDGKGGWNVLADDTRGLTGYSAKGHADSVEDVAGVVEGLAAPWEDRLRAMRQARRPPRP